MPFPQFKRHRMRLRPLAERRNKVSIERDRVLPNEELRGLSALQHSVIVETAERIVRARSEDRARMLVFGAHTIKNGLAPVLIALMEEGWLTHLATNGAGIIHDWEIAYQGATSEDVRENIRDGSFGAWKETGLYLNLAIVAGAAKGLGYGESVGAMVEADGIEIPTSESLKERISASANLNPSEAAAAADFLDVIARTKIRPGRLAIEHRFKEYGVQAAAHRLQVPFTGHPMIGHDIIYQHFANSCAAIGRAAERDFLSFVDSVSRLQGGVYLSLGSAVMSPMVFEKALSMARNAGEKIDDHFMTVVDLAKSHWDWTQGEPPEDNPDYYLRYNKSFARMGGTMRYLSADNRDFLLGLLRALRAA